MKEVILANVAEVESLLLLYRIYMEPLSNKEKK
jgi:hypothetical protein